MATWWAPVSNSGARQVFEALWAGEADVDAVIEAKGLKQMNDTGALEAIVAEVLAANPKSVDEFRAGKDKAFNALVGQVMKAMAGKGNPALVMWFQGLMKYLKPKKKKG